jgi:GTPase
VIDCANPHFETQMFAVERLIEKLGFAEIPRLRVFNKQDLVSSEIVANLCDTYDGTAVSALDSKTFPPLIRRMEDEILRSIALKEEIGDASDENDPTFDELRPEAAS